MAAVAGLAQLEYRTSCDHLAPVREEAIKHLLQIQQSWLTIHQRNHVHAEGVLQLRLLVQIVQHDIGQLTALQFNHDTHAGFIGFVTDIRDAVQLLVAYQLGNALEQ